MTVATDPVLAFDIGGTKIAAAVVSADRCLHRAQLPTPRTGRGLDIVAAMAELRQQLPQAGAIGVATTGIVREGRLTALNPTTLPIEDNFPLADALAERLGRRPLLINDAQAAGWSEYRFGAARGMRASAFITVSTGIGGAFVIDGRLQIGMRGLAGHIGHIVVDPDGPICGCGRKGCVERLASGTAIAALASAQYGRPMTALDVFTAEAEGDREAGAIIETAATLLARVIVDQIAALDLDGVVIGGGVGLASGFITRVQNALDKAPATFRRPIVPARLGADAGLIGAADLAHEEIFHR